ncbi:MAG: primosomal protein N' [Inquilinaceae bacterium]
MASPDATSPAAAPVDTAVPARRVSVLLPLPLGHAYDYWVPDGLVLEPGDYVRVPLGRRELIGVVWGPGTATVAESRLRDVLDRLDPPPLPAAARAFVDWVAFYVMSPPGAVLRMSISVPSAFEPARPVLTYRAPSMGALPPDIKLTAARRRVLDVARDGPALRATDLAREAGCGVGTVKAMAAAGLLATRADPPRLAVAPPDLSRPGPSLSADQAMAAETLVDRVGRGFSVTLLDGVTGSGKTEVYFEAVATALRAGRQVLVLLPEIALSVPWLDRFAARFGVRPVEWHSDLTALQRRLTWRAVAEGRVPVLVGARSALFLPYADLGLIVVDEEHEAAFKQEDGVPYNARDMAVVRARLGDFPAVLASATPSLETVTNVETNRYGRVHLPDRHGGATLPSVAAIDLRIDRPERQRFLSPTLTRALAETLAGGEQAMLFLNRRGYAPLTLCRACGHRLECPNCSAWLVDHRLAGRLQCHHCGYTRRRPDICPQCSAEDSFAACGPGVERIAEEVADLLPDARLLIMASDLIHGPGQAADLVRQITAHEVDLVIGTQLVAKGHHFPMLTLVGVVDADLGLAGGDLRAAERTYQLLHQVAGRAGRADRPGRVLLQSYMPEHPVIAAMVAGDRDGFMARESEARRRRGLPPFGRLAAILVSGPDATRVDRTAQALGRAAPRRDGVAVLGPAPAPLAVLRGQHRRRLLVKAARSVPLQAVIADWLRAVPVPNAVRVSVDIDPYGFL